MRRDMSDDLDEADDPRMFGQEFHPRRTHARAPRPGQREVGTHGPELLGEQRPMQVAGCLAGEDQDLTHVGPSHPGAERGERGAPLDVGDDL